MALIVAVPGVVAASSVPAAIATIALVLDHAAVAVTSVVVASL